MKVLLFAFLVFAIIAIASADKKKKKRTPRPTNADPQLYCKACKAIASEMVKKLGDSKSEVDIYDYVSDICNQKNFYVYDYPPPDMVKGCQQFIVGNEDALIKVFLKRESNEGIEDKLCLQETLACEDVDLETPSSMPQTVEINGVRHAIGPDGTIPGSAMEL